MWPADVHVSVEGDQDCDVDGRHVTSARQGPAVLLDVRYSREYRHSALRPEVGAIRGNQYDRHDRK